MVQQGSDIGCHKSSYRDSLNTVIIGSKEISFSAEWLTITNYHRLKKTVCCIR